MTMPGIRSARRVGTRTCGRRLCPRARCGGAARLARDREPATCFDSFCAKARKLGGAEMRPDTDAKPAPVEDIDTSPAAAVGQILIVDDMPANLIALESILESLGRPIKPARSGEEALGLLLERDFESRRREHEALSLRRERDRELVAKHELTRLNEALAENDRRKDSFLAILAHELRNPLAPIQSCVDLIRRAPGEPLTPKMIDVLERQTAALSRLVDDLLDVSRIKADKIALRPEPLDLVELIDNAVSSCAGLIEQRRHTLTVEAPAQPIEVIADSVRLAQVVCNLINNAARYTEPAGQIVVSCGAEDGFAWLRVRDTGLGNPPALQTTIFDMFVQERVRSDGSGGLGLGLALARRLVELHNGAIRVESEGPGKGSMFEVRLPLAASSHALVPRTRTGQLEPLTRPAPPATSIAVIADNDDARELLCELLRANGYEVLTATTAATARALITTHRPSVAIVDLGLPDSDGVTLVEQLRAHCPDLETRLIALPGYGTAADRERTKRAGFHAHLVKPSPVEAILACIADDRGGA